MGLEKRGGVGLLLLIFLIDNVLEKTEGACGRCYLPS